MTFLKLALLLVFTVTGSGLAQEKGHDADAHTEGARFLLSDVDSSTISVLDLATDKVLGNFSTPGAAGSAYASPSGRYGLVVHRNENRVSVVHPGLGLEGHSDHADLVPSNP